VSSERMLRWFGLATRLDHLGGGEKESKNVCDIPDKRSLLHGRQVSRVVYKTICDRSMVPLGPPQDIATVQSAVVQRFRRVVLWDCSTPGFAHDCVHVLVIYPRLRHFQDLLDLTYCSWQFCIGDGLVLLQPAICFEEVVDILGLLVLVHTQRLGRRSWYRSRAWDDGRSSGHDIVDGIRDAEADEPSEERHENPFHCLEEKARSNVMKRRP
jgi:hypothetical protein